MLGKYRSYAYQDLSEIRRHPNGIVLQMGNGKNIKIPSRYARLDEAVAKVQDSREGVALKELTEPLPMGPI